MFNKVDVIVVGGGPAGVSAGITLARAGKQVVIIERGDFAGSKNMFGGAIYAKPTAEIFPAFWETAPIERNNKEHRYIILNDKSATSFSYKKFEKGSYSSFTATRAKWDRWCIEEAKKAGAFFAPKTVVRELIKDSGRVIGIRTDEEDFYADIVILADGVNSLLAKQAGLRKNIMPKNVALGVKEVIKLPKELIDARFNLKDDEGTIIEIIGGPMAGMMGLGYIYTNKDSVVVGLGIALDELAKRRIKPYELLNSLKEHPEIQSYIEGGELVEYAAHLIPEGGYKSIPKLYADGVMVVGDAAMLVNNVHWEGTNLALISGKMAADVAIEALENHDYSANMLSLYQEKLENCCVLKDLKTYKDVVDIIHSNTDGFLDFYPNKVAEFFDLFTTVDSEPKKFKFRQFIKNLIKQRGFAKIFKDKINIIKLIIGVLK